MNKYIFRGLIGACFVGGLWAVGATGANAATTSGSDGLLSGTQLYAVVSAPVQAAGNAVSVVGDSVSGSAPAAAAPVAAAPAPAASAGPAAPAASAPAPAAPAASAPTTTGASGILSGTQGIVSVPVPVTVTGNAISVVGDSHSASAAQIGRAHV